MPKESALSEMSKDVVQKTIANKIAGMILKEMIKKTAFLSIPVVTTIAGVFIAEVVLIAIARGILFLKDVAIDIAVHDQATKFDKAIDRLEEVKKKGSKEDKVKAEAEIKKAEDELKEAAKAFIKLR